MEETIWKENSYMNENFANESFANEPPVKEDTAKKSTAKEWNKKGFSTILMLVGALFVTVSGGIFVSQTWQYLSELAKTLCLIAVTGVLFGGSVFTRTKWALKKTSVALYYLGTCFTGFSAFSLAEIFKPHVSISVSLTLAAMSVPIVLRLMKGLNVFDLLLQIILADGLVTCIAGYPFLDSIDATLCALSAVTLLLAGLNCYNYRNLSVAGKETAAAQKTGVYVTTLVTYLIHAIIVLFCSIVLQFTGKHIAASLFGSLILLVSVTVLYKTYQNTLLRVMHSLTLVFFQYVAVSSCVQLFFPETGLNCLGAICFIAFALNLVTTFVSNRTEMRISVFVLAVLSTLFQEDLYTIYQSSGTFNGIHYPYAFCMALGLVLWMWLGKISFSVKTTYKLACSWLALGVNAFMASVSAVYCLNYSREFLMALIVLQVGIALNKYDIVSAIFKVLALLFAIEPLILHAVNPVCFFDKTLALTVDFTVEYICAILAISIVLLRRICYPVIKDMSLFQFVAVCCLLVILVYNNILIAALPNVMFLSIIALGILLIATIQKNKKYAIASAATLVLVVLYLTKALWMSIAWWVYLFVAGVGLIVYAIKREKSGQ